MNAKMVIVWRNDLKEIPLGKKFAQVGHSAHLFLTSKVKEFIQSNEYDFDGKVALKLSQAEIEWCLGNYKKVAVLVRSESDLMTIHDRAKELGLPTELVTDEGLTVFTEPTRTCLAIGPAASEDIDKVTGESGPLGKLRLV